MPEIRETLDEFCQRHGGEVRRVAPNLRLLPDGAQLRDTGFGAVAYEPPADGEERLDTRRRYHTTKLEVAEKDFEMLKRALSGQGRFYWPEDDEYGPSSRDGLTDLRTIQNIVLIEREALDAIEAEYNQLPSVIERRRRDEAIRQFERAQRQKEEEIKSTVEAINI